MGTHHKPNTANRYKNKMKKFKDAIEETKNNGDRSILLGNGFSQACDNDSFSYTALFDEAKNKFDDKIICIFNKLKTQNFEYVIRSLEKTKDILEIYQIHDSTLIDKIDGDIDNLRNSLADMLTMKHPDRMNKIDHHKFAACRLFLRNFKRFYTLNYDLLLYWSFMNKEADMYWDLIDGEVDSYDLLKDLDDGFRSSDQITNCLEWQGPKNTEQNMFYVHGALHIFDLNNGSKVQKLSFLDKQEPLIDQIRTQLKGGHYPIYVSEGNSDLKKKRIRSNEFLYRAYQSLYELNGTLFVFGFSFSRNDEHIISHITDSRLDKIYVSIFGDPHSDKNTQIIDRANQMKTKRREVHFFDAKSAKVWG